MAKIFGALFLLAVLLIAGWAYYFFFGPQPADVGLEFETPSRVFVGQPFDLPVSFANYSDRVIQNAKLSLLLPEDMVFAGQSPDQRVLEQVIGNLGPGSLNKHAFKLVVTGGPDSVKRLEARLTYSLDGSNGEFTSRNEADLEVSKGVADLTFSLPERVFSGENFDITLRYSNNSSQELKNLRLRLDYPPTFQFQKASEKATKGNNEWQLGSLAKGSSGELVISGNVVGADRSAAVLTGTLLSDNQGQAYTIQTQTASIILSVSPLSLDIRAGTREEVFAQVGERMTYTIRYRNNSEVTMENVNIQAALIGEMFNFSTARSEGAFNSLTNTFTWNPASNPKLARLEPGTEGTVDFLVEVKGAYPARKISDRDFKLTVDGRIESPTVPPGTSASRTVSLARAETKIMGQLGAEMRGLFRDAASGILNSGPYPPRVNKPTQYTIHWVVRNYATDLSELKLSASLQSGTRFTGKVKSTIEAVPVYNPASGEVTWNIGNLAATKGVLGSPIEAIFQVENTPAVNQVGNPVPLIGPLLATALDTWTGQRLRVEDTGITTDLPDDTTFTGQDRRVQP